MSTRVDQLVDTIVQQLLKQHQTVSTAESCTSGRLSTALANAEGASMVFAGGFVTYTKDAKTQTSRGRCINNRAPHRGLLGDGPADGLRSTAARSK
jgi:hypothetical protein